MSPSVAIDAARAARATAEAARDLASWLPDVKASDDALRRAAVEASSSSQRDAGDALTRADDARERGNARYRAGDYDDACKAYTESVRIAPSAAAHANRAMARLKMSDFHGVVEDCDACVALDPEYGSKVYHRRGVANRELGKYLESVMDFERALRLEPTSGLLKEERAKSQRAFELEAKVRPTQTRHRVRVESDDDEEEDRKDALKSMTQMPVLRADDETESGDEQEAVTIRRARSTADAARPVVVAAEDTDLVKAATKIATRKPLVAPRNGAEFEKTYRRAMKFASSSSSSDELGASRVDVLRLVPVTKIPSMFASGLDPDLLVDIATVVVRDMFAIDAPSALKWLEELPKLPRFVVSLALAPRLARDALADAFNAVVIERDAVARIRATFAL